MNNTQIVYCATKEDECFFLPLGKKMHFIVLYGSKNRIYCATGQINLFN